MCLRELTACFVSVIVKKNFNSMFIVSVSVSEYCHVIDNAEDIFSTRQIRFTFLKYFC